MAVRTKKTNFSFKQFDILQDACAMKVCTDACVLGAFVSVNNAKNILDIGTGTGLLALMMAQRTAATIDAVEIDTDAYTQAIQNIENSPFNKKIKIYNCRIQDFIGDNIAYDLIVSNPPFYQNSLQSADYRSNKALHAAELSFEELLQATDRLLSKNGRFVVLLPPFETEKLKNLAMKVGFFSIHQLYLHHDDSRAAFRIITTFSRAATKDYSTYRLIIWEEPNKIYSTDFQQLLKNYYTIFD